MPISVEYASMSEDKKAILLPDDVQRWVNGAERFVWNRGRCYILTF